MGSWPLAQSLFYQYKHTMGRPELLRGKRSAQAAATPNRPSSLIDNAARFAPNRPTPAQSREEIWGPPQHPAGWQPPGHRSRGRPAWPATPIPAPERRAAAAGRCTPLRSRGTLKDGRRRPKPCGVRQSRAVWPSSRPSPWSWTTRADCPPLNKAPVSKQRVSRIPQRSQPIFVRCAAWRPGGPPGGVQGQNISLNISHRPFPLLRTLLRDRLWAIRSSAFQADDAGSIPAARLFF
jgi:hypothetical protein